MHAISPAGHAGGVVPAGLAAIVRPVTTLLVLSIDAIRLALDHRDVLEVVRAVAITPVSGCPDVIEGVVNLRGVVVPVYDLRRRVGLPATPIGVEEHLVVVSAGPRGLAIIRASRVHEICKVEETQITAARETADPMIRGLVTLPDGLLVLCDLAAFLADAEADATALALSGVKAAS